MQAPAIGGWKFFRTARKNGFLHSVGELWREHGDVFQVRTGSSPLVFVVHPDAVVRVLGTHKHVYDKAQSYDAIRQFLLGDGIVTSTGELWRRQRRLMAPFFTPRGIQAYAGVIVADALRMREHWRELARSGAEVDIDQEMANVTASIILQALFSTPGEDSIAEFKEAIETMIEFANSKLGPSLPAWLPTAHNRRYKRARALEEVTVARLVEARRAVSEQEWPDDLLTRMMTARDPETGEGMSERLLHDEAMTAFVAGYETTATTLSFAWYALAQNPYVAARLHEELDRVLGGRTPTLEDLKQLDYTFRVVKEVLRLYPAAPVMGRDAVEADEIGGFEIPQGARILLCPYYTQRHPDFWDDPEVFEPDRWLHEADMHEGAFYPFGIGQRICLGKHLSLLESHILLAVLAQEFAPRLSEGSSPAWEMRGVLQLNDGLPMTLSPRPVAGDRTPAVASAVRDRA